MASVTYLRISTQTNEQGNGFERQKEDCQRLSGRSKTFRDIISGSKPFHEREGFSQMLEYMNEKGIKTIYISTMCRLARELRRQEEIIYYLISKDINLICASTGENITEAYKNDPMRCAMVQMIGIFSQLDKNTIVQKLKKGREAKKALTGKCEGRKHYGEESEEERIILDHMFFLRDCLPFGRMTFKRIAHKLNQEGYTNRSNRQWSASNVRQIMNRVKQSA